MRIHHLNCISSCPLGGALVDGGTVGLRGRLACHCLLIETGSGLVLVDTGFGLGDVAHPRRRLGWLFRLLLRPELRAEMTAVRQLQRLGFRARDVRHIVLTHLDFDHAGGLDDFPGASVHMLAQERDAALARASALDRMRYRPQQWASTQPRWHVYRSGEGEPWFGFDCVRQLDGLPPEILLVPLVGHTLGHAGVAVRPDNPVGGREWLLHAGDAYFHHGEMRLRRPRCTPGLRFYQWMMEQKRGARLWNQGRLRDLRRRHGGEVLLFSAHDPCEFERLAGRRLGQLPPTPLRAPAAPLHLPAPSPPR
jgi:glyoxylase-like metal-dependent hydrolase (beta-lactamase superfamily II)